MVVTAVAKHWRIYTKKTSTPNYSLFYIFYIGVRECFAFPNFGQYKPEREGFMFHKEHYDRMHQKLTHNEKYAKKMVKVRSKTVEPVIGTLVNFTNMKRVNTRGIKNANKHVLMASLTYNLKKYLRFITKKPSILVQVLSLKQGKCFAFSKRAFSVYKNSILSTPNFSIFNFN